MFTREDARLTDRVVDQLRRAVAFDKAVEQGRSEERARIAQDLHDDIGARLLTLMYKAPTPEMEDYVRHTLQDLKTLTRGLAAPDHRLTHAGAEWKADMTQRLTAAQLSWLVVQLRPRHEAQRGAVVGADARAARAGQQRAVHASATPSTCRLHFERGRFTLQVTDDGVGRDRAWAHGLGLGGVRKRVKQLGGEVAWRENPPCGIVCRVAVPGLASAAWRPV